ncbi:hypothetical protein Strvi_0113 (plasmid) [Streptomyces violaceusniger Tu 4113]|uniref:Uncharacterized protein n=1 Tax=Streptomyces violaceusniger (strain Tu 4113) TaxID=653045 RepID=G2PHT8_STRV4|nr:hypothetical protein Strvi_0113 [Streptomyces violaceusniger Tu 4113]
MRLFARWRYTTCTACSNFRKGCRRGVCRLCVSRAVTGAPGRTPRPGGPARVSGASGRSDFRREVTYGLAGDSAEGILARLLRGAVSFFD